jgi:hypothetical protein
LAVAFVLAKVQPLVSLVVAVAFVLAKVQPLVAMAVAAGLVSAAGWRRGLCRLIG